MTLGEAVRSTADAMRGNPSCLAAIILAGLFAVLTYFALQREAERSEQRIEATLEIIKRCYPDNTEGGN